MNIAHKNGCNAMLELFKPLENDPGTYQTRFHGYTMPAYFPIYWPQLYNFPIDEGDIVVTTFPKSGTTWMQQIAYLVATQDFEGAASRRLDDRCLFLEMAFQVAGPLSLTDDQIKNYPKPNIIKTHMPAPFLPKDINKAKTIFLYRNAKDCMVSYYHMYKSLKFGPFSQFKGTVEDYAKLFMEEKLDRMPFGKFVTDYFEYRNSGKLTNILFLKYEDMKCDTRKAIRQVANFLGKTLSNETVERIYQETTVESMKKNDAANYSWMEGAPNFVRKGIVGDWKNELKDPIFVEQFDKYIQSTIPTYLNLNL